MRCDMMCSLCFDTESTVQNHAQMGGYQVGSEFIGDWIVENL